MSVIGKISGEVATRFSPLHSALVEQGAHFDVSLGWPYVLWFGDVAEAEGVRAEHQATRNSVGIFDVSLLTKVLVEGSDACALLDHRSTAIIDVPVGSVVYTPWCDEAGVVGIDLSITRIGDDRFLLVATEMLHDDLLAELNELATNTNVVVTDQTAAFALLSVQGANSKALLEQLTETPLSIESFSLYTSQYIELGGIEVLAVRMTFTGDCGWELHVPAAKAEAVYKMLFDHGVDLGARACGITAMHTCGAEKGFLDMAEHVAQPLNAFEANFAFAIDFSPNREYPGRVALEQIYDSPLLRRMVLVKSAEQLKPGAAVSRDTVDVGSVTWAAYGHTLESWVGFAFIDATFSINESSCESGTWSVEVNGHQQPLSVGLAAWHDPHDITMLI